MSTVHFTANLRRHVDTPSLAVDGATVGEALEAYFASNPRARSYVLDDQGGARKHVAIFVNARPVGDRTELSDPVGEDDSIYVMQALSGG